MTKPDPYRVKQVAEYSLNIDGMKLPLRRFATPEGGEGSEQPVQSVLLLHGGNTNSELFHMPRGGLVRFLADRHCDVWTLDWRTSPTLLWPLLRTRGPLFGSVGAERDVFTLDHVAQTEIPEALKQMRTSGAVGDISVLGFCLGGGALAKAVAQGRLEGLGVGNVVLATMGLFYEVPWNGWVKSEDFILERLLSTDPKCRSIDPFNRANWPEPMRRAHRHWPEQWLGSTGSDPVDELFKNLTFCYGEPYARARLDPEFERELDERFFGPIHIGMYLHASQMIRRGYSARFDALDVIDRTRITRASEQLVGTDLLPEHFKTKRVTAIAGSDDRLWHRDSIDLMYEWLRNEATDRGADPRRERQRHKKHIVQRYGHLDLFWGKDAHHDVYPYFHSGLTRPDLAPRNRPVGRKLTKQRRSVTQC